MLREVVRKYVQPRRTLANWGQRPPDPERERQCIEASALFNAEWYLRRYPDVAIANFEPLAHYIMHGHAAGYFPNPIFDSAWYSSNYGLSGTNPLEHYIRTGRRRGLWPNRMFDPAYYAAKYGVSRRNVLKNYLDAGPEAHRDTIASLPCAELRRRYPSHDTTTYDLETYLRDYSVIAAINVPTSYYVSGWACRPCTPQTKISILVNGKAQGAVEPWIARPDVKAATGHEALGFVFSFPVRLSDSDVVSVADEFGYVLPNCTSTYTVLPLGTTTDFYACRASVAATFLKGRGLEIGAFTQPTDLPPDREVLFFDRYPTAELLAFYDRDCGRPLMEPTYVGEAQTLASVPDADFDFVIANHVIEHLLDPISFLKAVLAKLREGGRAMILAPDKEHGFDAPRPLTSFEHLVQDHAHGGERSQSEHFHEWAYSKGLTGEAAVALAASFEPSTTLFHYHVWTASTFALFVKQAIAFYDLPARVIYEESTMNDLFVVIERNRSH